MAHQLVASIRLKKKLGRLTWGFESDIIIIYPVSQRFIFKVAESFDQLVLCGLCRDNSYSY